MGNAANLVTLPIRDILFNFYARKGLEQLNATVRWTVAGDGSTEANLYFLSHLRKKMQTSPFRRTPSYGRQENGLPRPLRLRSGSLQ